MQEFEEIQLKSSEERSRVLRKMNTLIDTIPDEIAKHKVMPLVLTVFDYGTPDYTSLPVLLKIGGMLPADDFQRRVVPCLIKLFSSPDRATRIHLLQHLKSYIEHLDRSVINKEIFQHVVTGFSDTHPAVREETVKAMELLAPKLDTKNLSEELMRHFARLQGHDEEV